VEGSWALVTGRSRVHLRQALTSGTMHPCSAATEMRIMDKSKTGGAEVRPQTGRYRVQNAALTIATGGLLIVLAGCGPFGRGEPTRTPVPTFTPTPILVVVPAGTAPSAEAAQTAIAAATESAAQLPPSATPEPPTATPVEIPATPTDTPAPTDTPTPEPTATPTSEPTATAVVDYGFVLEAAEKFPTESLAPNVVRVYAYVYSPREFGLGDYSLRVTHNGADLPVDQTSTAGLPQVTRQDPGPYSRFTNLNAIFVEAQAGDWTVQLVDKAGVAVGPAAMFQLSADEDTRELYVRYRLTGN